jgi:hypothetical protein
LGSLEIAIAVTLDSVALLNRIFPVPGSAIDVDASNSHEKPASWPSRKILLNFVVQEFAATVNFGS